MRMAQDGLFELEIRMAGPRIWVLNKVLTTHPIFIYLFQDIRYFHQVMNETSIYIQ